MTTIGDLIAYLQQFPQQTLVFTNQYGHDWSTEHPIDLFKCQYYKSAIIYRNEIDGQLEYVENDVDIDVENIPKSIGEQPVLRLVA